MQAGPHGEVRGDGHSRLGLAAPWRGIDHDQGGAAPSCEQRSGRGRAWHQRGGADGSLDWALGAVGKAGDEIFGSKHAYYD